MVQLTKTSLATKMQTLRITVDCGYSAARLPYLYSGVRYWAVLTARPHKKDYVPNSDHGQYVNGSHYNIDGTVVETSSKAALYKIGTHSRS